jgi:predicted  nucleic acid-binding Zn-ribbon protein
MIDALLFGSLGFLLGCLLALILAPPLWNRAVKLTTRRLEATMPMTLNDIQADKDQLRAEFAIELRKVEVALDKAREKAARELIEANKRRGEIAMLNTDLASVRAKLQENENANRVLQQTIKRRLPDLDSRLKAAKKALAELESVNAELRTTIASQSEALKTARATLHNQRADIDRLRVALESGSGAALRGLGRPDARTLAESQRLSAELSKAQEELARAQTSAQESALLRRELRRLASQILAVARAQGLTQAEVPQPVVEVAEAYVEETAAEELQAHPPHAEQQAQSGNGTGHAVEDEDTETGVHSVAAAMGPGAPHDENAENKPDEAEVASDEPKSFARKFVARRKARRTRKAGGTSLGDRLRGIVAERPDN